MGLALDFRLPIGIEDSIGLGRMAVAGKLAEVIIQPRWLIRRSSKIAVWNVSLRIAMNSIALTTSAKNGFFSPSMDLIFRVFGPTENFGDRAFEQFFECGC